MLLPQGRCSVPAAMHGCGPDHRFGVPIHACTAPWRGTAFAVPVQGARSSFHHLASGAGQAAAVWRERLSLLRDAFSLGAVWAQALKGHLLAALIPFRMRDALQPGDTLRVGVF